MGRGAAEGTGSFKPPEDFSTEGVRRSFGVAEKEDVGEREFDERWPSRCRCFSAAISATSLSDIAEGDLWDERNENLGLGWKASLVSASFSWRALTACRRTLETRYHVRQKQFQPTSAYVR